MRTLSCVLAVVVALSTVAYAADSPQFRGPFRDGKFLDFGLLKEWPEGGPATVWVANGLGKGYSTVSVVGNTIYTTGMLDDNQGYLFILDTDGAVKTKFAYGDESQDGQAPGPRSTPTVDGDRVYVISALGVVTCFKMPEGNILWQVDALGKFTGKNIQWTIAESPLVDGENVICSPGGPDAGIAALNKMTGETVWTSKGFSEPSAYCSPSVIEQGDRRIIVTMGAKSVVGVDAATGQVLWTHPHETEYDIHAVTPAFEKGLLYYTGGYNSGGGMLELSADGSSITPKWNDKNLDCQHHGVVLLDGYIYGTAHQSGKGLVCLDLKTGEMKWNSEEVTQGDIIYADGMLYIYEGPKKGVVSLVKADPNGFQKTGSLKVTEGADKHWAHPTIANGRLYIRHGDALIAYDIKG